MDFIGAREPQLITYGFYIDEDAAKMTVVAVHPDSAPLELHMDMGTKEFAKLAHLLTLTAIECYGRPSERALGQLRHKAATMGESEDRCLNRTFRWVHAPRIRDDLSDRANGDTFVNYSGGCRVGTRQKG